MTNAEMLSAISGSWTVVHEVGMLVDCFTRWLSFSCYDAVNQQYHTTRGKSSVIGKGIWLVKRGLLVRLEIKYETGLSGFSWKISIKPLYICVCCRPANYERRSSPVYSRYDSDQPHSRVSNSRGSETSQLSGADRDGRSADSRRRSAERERRRSRSTERRPRPNDYHSSTSRRRSPERDRDRDRHSRRDTSHRSPDRRSHRDYEKSRRGGGDRKQRSHRSQSRERRHSHSRSRHSSHSRKDREPRPTKDRSSPPPVSDSRRSLSPKPDGPFEQDLQKELERVAKSRSVEEQNGSGHD